MASPDLDVFRLEAFLTGYELGVQRAGGIDASYSDFTHWLRDVKKEHPSGGWTGYFLAWAMGDQAEAVRLVAQRIEEFLSCSPEGGS